MGAAARLKHAIVVAVVASTYFFPLAMLYSPLVRDMQRGYSLSDMTLQYYFSDKLANLGIVRNVHDGYPANVEPYTRTGNSLYASGYHSVLGQLSRIGSLGPFGAWNVGGFLCVLLLCVLSGWWGRWATGRTVGWLAGSIPIMIGIFYLPEKAAWVLPMERHAVIWPAFAIINAAASETPGLLLCATSLYCLVRAFRQEPYARLWAAAAGFLGGATLNVHIYVAMFTVLAGFLFVLFDSLRTLPRRPLVVATWTVIAAAALALVPSEMHLFKLAALLAAAGSIPVLRASWRATRLALAWRYWVGLIAGAAPQLFLLGAATLRNDRFLKDRQGTTYGLSLPLDDVLLRSLPVVLLVIGAFVWRPWFRRDEQDASPTVLLSSLVVTSGLLIFNTIWGLNQEPYRFLPYATLLLGTAAFPWLVARGGSLIEKLARLGVALVIVSTLGSARLFAKENSDRVLHVSAGEARAYQEIADLLPPGKLVHFAGCVPGEVFKVVTGAPIAGFNRGMAYPKQFDAVFAVIDAAGRGRLPGLATLQQADVGLVVRDPTCETGISAQTLQAVLGAPVHNVAVDDVHLRWDPTYHFWDEVVGTLRLEVYAVPSGSPEQAR